MTYEGNNPGTGMAHKHVDSMDTQVDEHSISNEKWHSDLGKSSYLSPFSPIPNLSAKKIQKRA